MRRDREITLHTAAGGFRFTCAAGATVSELLEVVGLDMTIPEDTAVFWVPPPTSLSDAEQLEVLHRTIRKVAPCSPSPDALAKPSPVEQRLIDRVESAIIPRERIGKRITELWLSLPIDWVGPNGEVAPARAEAARVRVTCLKPAGRGSVSRRFYVETPMGRASVGMAREWFGEHMPRDARVFAPSHFHGSVPLTDLMLVPDQIMLSDFTAPVSIGMVCTAPMCWDIQDYVISQVRKEEFQRLLDGFEAEANGNPEHYRAVLNAYLSEKIYPPLAREYGLEERSFMRIAIRAFGVHHNTNVLWNCRWMQLEKLLRNQVGVAMAWGCLRVCYGHT